MRPHYLALSQLVRLNPHVLCAHYDDPHNPSAIIIHVDMQISHHSLTLPKAIEALPVIIFSTNPIQTLICPAGPYTADAPHQACQDEPIQLGTQIQPAHGNWFGTAGAPCTWPDAAGNRCFGILSNWHVMHADNTREHYNQHQPDRTRPRCAYLANSTPVQPNGPNTTDAAVADAMIDGLHTIDTRILEIGPLHPEPVDAYPNLDVCKSGRTTGLTSARCSAVGASVKVGYGDFTALFENQDVFEATGPAFSAPGDSGSLIVTCEGHHPVALLFAGSSKLTIGNPVRHVAKALDLTFDFP